MFYVVRFSVKIYKGFCAAIFDWKVNNNTNRFRSRLIINRLFEIGVICY